MLRTVLLVSALCLALVAGVSAAASAPATRLQMHTQAAEAASAVAPLEGSRAEDAELLQAALPVCYAGSYAAYSTTTYQCPAGQFKTTPKSGTGTCCTCYPGQWSTDGTRCSSCGYASDHVNTAAPPSTAGYCFCAAGWGVWQNNVCTAPCAAHTYNAGGTTDLWPGNVVSTPDATGFVNPTGQCRPCAQGTDTTTLGSTSCASTISCTGNTYPGGQPLSCLSCPASGANKGTTGVGNGQTCQCAPGYSTWNPATGSCSPCPMGSAGNDGTCSQCGLGTAAPSLGQTSCTPCGPGSFAATAGQSQCTPCAIGTASSASSRHDQCDPCGAGLYASSQGSSQCSTCTAGKVSYASAAGNSQCTACAGGKYAVSTSQCTDCSINQYSEDNANGITQCSLCPANTQNPNTGSNNHTACVNCPQGQSSASGESCSACGPNHYFVGSVCTECPDGYSSSSPVLATPQATLGSCLPCQSPLVGKGSGLGCTACAAGQYRTSLADGLTSANGCTLCPTATYSSATGLTSASQCKYCATADATTGYGPGFVPTLPGRTSCTQCLAGSRVSDDADSCQLCANEGGPNAGLNKVSKTNGALTCETCPVPTQQDPTAPYTTANDNHTDCVGCQPGSYFDLSNGLPNALCRPCPQGSYTTGVGETSCHTCARIDESISWSLTNARASTAAPGVQVGATKCYCATGYTRKAVDFQGSATPDYAGDKCTVHNCAPGQYLRDLSDPTDAGRSQCVPCPVNTFCSSAVGCGVGKASCTPCNGNAFTNGKTGQASCVCRNLAGAPAAQPPPENQYEANSLGDAAPTPAASLTDEAAVASGAFCNPLCAQGQFYDNNRRCQPCPKNFFCPSYLTFGCQGACLPCTATASSTLNMLGATRCTCAADYQDQDGSEDGSGCVPAAIAPARR